MMENGQVLLSNPNDPESEPVDGRRCVKITSWIAFAVGTIIGLYSFVYVLIVFKDQGPDEI